jgi:hypothetical protein
VVRGWPPITEPELLQRLALDDAAFRAQGPRMASIWGSRELQPADLERALGYPWERPASSYVLRGDDVEQLDKMDPDARARTVGGFIESRYPLLAYGGNGAPSWLQTKFAHFDDPADRSALVLAGELHDFDVGVAAVVSPFGYMPATLFASPGTAVRASIVWTTERQATQLTWSEVPYRLVRLDEARFVSSEAGVEVEQIFAFLHRVGCFCPEGSPVALAAVPAVNRTATALSEHQLLEIAATLMLTEGSTAEDLVRAVFHDASHIATRAMETILLSAQHLEGGWTPFPTAAGRSPT